MLITTMAPGQNAKGTLRLFAARDNSVLSASQLSASVSSPWEQWSNVATTPGIVKQFAVGTDAAGRINAFALTLTGQCYHILEATPNGEDFQPRNIGAVAWQQIALSRNGDGRLELFALVSGTIYHLWQTNSNGQWSSSQAFPTSGVQQIAVAANATGGIDVFALGGGNVWHFGKKDPSSQWSNSESFGTTGLEQIAVARNADGTLEVFGLAAGNVWHFWQTGPTGWSNSASFGTSGLEQIAVTQNGQGALEVFGLAAGNIWHFHQKTAKTKNNPNVQWSNSESFGTIGLEQMAVALNANKLLEVFALGGNKVWHFGQTGTNTWSHSVQLL